MTSRPRRRQINPAKLPEGGLPSAASTEAFPIGTTLLKAGDTQGKCGCSTSQTLVVLRCRRRRGGLASLLDISQCIESSSRPFAVRVVVTFASSLPHMCGNRLRTFFRRPDLQRINSSTFLVARQQWVFYSNSRPPIPLHLSLPPLFKLIYPCLILSHLRPAKRRQETYTTQFSMLSLTPHCLFS